MDIRIQWNIGVVRKFRVWSAYQLKAHGEVRDVDQLVPRPGVRVRAHARQGQAHESGVAVHEKTKKNDKFPDIRKTKKCISPRNDDILILYTLGDGLQHERLGRYEFPWCPDTPFRSTVVMFLRKRPVHEQQTRGVHGETYETVTVQFNNGQTVKSFFRVC